MNHVIVMLAVIVFTGILGLVLCEEPYPPPLQQQHGGHQ